MPIGNQQMRFLINLAYRWPDAVSKKEGYEGKYSIPYGHRRNDFIMRLLDLDLITMIFDDEYELTQKGWKLIVNPNPKHLYKRAYKEWDEKVRPQLNRHILPPGGLREVLYSL